jgi:hypothetical protein
MGVFYNSICIRGQRSEETKAALARWLSGRGFQPTDEPILFDLDAESERSAFLVWNERWTLIFFSHWEEERRLIRELQNGLAPLLYLWVYDSDEWGWDLFDSFGFAGSFSSDAKAHRSFAEQTDEPRVPGDPAKLCERLGLDPALAAEIRKLEKRQVSFKEDLAREMCGLIGAPPALSSYDELESGMADQHEGWCNEQVLYFHYPAAKAAIDVDLDLHAYEPGSGLYPLRRPPEMSAEMRREMEAMRRRARFTMFWLKPLTALAGWWEKLRLAGRRAEEAPPPSDAAISVVRTETATRHWVSNHRHGVRMLLPMGADPLPVSGKPAMVFAFQAGELSVTCNARRRRALREVLRKPSRARILRDEKYSIGPLPARHLLFEQDGRQPGEQSWLALHVVQTGWALYVFIYRMSGRIDAEAEAVVRATLKSFEVFQSKIRPNAEG